MKKLLLITNDIIGDSSAGPGIRYLELSKAMAGKGCQVVLLGRKPAFSAPQLFSYSALTLFNIVKYVRRSDCIILRGGGPLTTFLTLLLGHNKDIIADVYGFTQFEVPHIVVRNRIERFITQVRNIFHIHKLKLYGRHIKKFWVASERQKSFLLGFLYAQGTIKEINVSLVPFGYPMRAPLRKKNALRGVIQGISDNDFILIWGGGVWDWLDPITLVKAMKHIQAVDPNVKLYFMGIRAPSGYLPAKAEELVRVSRELGVLDKNVFIHDGWIPYAERTDYLLDANAGVSLHPESLETYYSYRTRNLDYVYCGLPMIHTAGDVWAELIEKKGLGIVVQAGDVRAVSDAILRIRNNPNFIEYVRKNIEDNYKEFSWEFIAREAARSIETDMAAERTFFLLRNVQLVTRYAMFSLQTFSLLFKTMMKS